MTAQAYINNYNLQQHPEGGWYKETYKSEELIPAIGLPNRFETARSFSTAIYFLLEQGNFSAFHRIKSDELWYYHDGDVLEIIEMDESGNEVITRLGKLLHEGCKLQHVVKAGRWFGARPAAGSEFCLVGCQVSPGFDFRDFELK